MSRRGGHSSAGGIQLLPFLDILTCTMGALVTLLFAFARYGQQQVVKVSDAKQVAAEAAAADDIEDLQWRASMLRDSRTKTEADLEGARLELSHLEDHLQRLRQRAEELHQAALALDNSNPAVPGTQESAELAKMKERIVLTQQELEQARKNASERPTTYSIVPYAGPNQTRRRPIYIECRGDGVILEPEGIVFTDDDFAGPLGPGNPLAAAVRAAREYMASADPDSFDKVEPYPLLVVRPDGIPQYYGARSALASFGSQFGYELIGADKKLKFPEADPRMGDMINNVVAEARIRQAQLIAAAPKQYRKKRKGTFSVNPQGGGLRREPEPQVAQAERNPYKGLGGRGSGGGKGNEQGTGGNGNGGTGSGGYGTTTGTTTGTSTGTATGTTTGTGGLYAGDGNGGTAGGNGGEDPLGTGNLTGGGGSDGYGAGGMGPGGFGAGGGAMGSATPSGMNGRPGGYTAGGNGPEGNGADGNGTGVMGPGGMGAGGSNGLAPPGGIKGGGPGAYTTGGGGVAAGGFGPGGGAAVAGANGQGLGKPGAIGLGRAGGVPGAGLSALETPGGNQGGQGGPGAAKAAAVTGTNDTPGGSGEGDDDGNGGDGTSGTAQAAAGQMGTGGGGTGAGRLSQSGDAQPESDNPADATASSTATPQTTTLQGTGGATAGNAQGTGSGTGPGGGGLGGLGGKGLGNATNTTPNGTQKPGNGGGPAVPNNRAEQATNASAHSIGGAADDTGPAQSSNNNNPGSTGTSGGGGSMGGQQGQQQPVGMPMPKLNFGQTPQDPSQGPHGKKFGSQSRPPGWALPDAPNTTASVARPVVIECWPDRLVMLGDDGKTVVKQIPLTQNTEDAVDELVSSVWQQMKLWGSAGKGLSWRPTLTMRVAPDARQRFDELRSLLADSGLEFKESSHKLPVAGRPANPLRK